MTDERARAAAEIVGEWVQRGFILIDPGHRHALIGDIEHAVAQAVTEAQEQWMLYVGQPGDPTYESLVKEIARLEAYHCPGCEYGDEHGN